MPVNSTHAEHEANLPAWLRARDVMAGEDAVKRGGERYVPRLDAQSDDDYVAYLARASFFNATARTAEGFVGLIFRRAPFLKLPETGDPIGAALDVFEGDADMLGTTLHAYAKSVVDEVVALGRAGTLVDWESGLENRAYATLYRAESILNWRTTRVNGRNLLTLVVLSEPVEEILQDGPAADIFVSKPVEQIRVLRLVGGGVDGPGASPLRCVVEVWRRIEGDAKEPKAEWVLMETRTPVRRGKPLPLIPFVFHGPRHSRPAVDKLPLADIITVNLDHYRLDADYKHGIHYTALPTAWVVGFDKSAPPRIGSSTAWCSDTVGAQAGFLEFTGQGLTTFERAMDRDERIMSVLGSRLLEGQKKVGETAAAIELRQSGENSILATLAASLSESLTHVLRWAYWWNATDETPDAVNESKVLLTLNTDFSTKGLSAQEITAVVKSWQAGAISQDTMLELFRRGEVLPDGRSNEEEERLVAKVRQVQAQAPGLGAQAPAGGPSAKVQPAGVSTPSTPI